MLMKFCTVMVLYCLVFSLSQGLTDDIMFPSLVLSLNSQPRDPSQCSWRLGEDEGL